jgi:type I restriction enzyme M protein
MDKSNYFGILKQLHDICRNNPAPKLTAMDAYNEIINFLYLRHLSDNCDIDEAYNLKTLYEEYCTNAKIEQDLENKERNKLKSGKEPIELYYEQLSEKLLPGLIDNERNKTIAFTKIMGENLTDLKVDIGRMTYILHQDHGSSTEDGGQKAQKLINKIYSEDFLPLNKDGLFNMNLFPYDALGEGFEKFMNEAGSTGGNWGQHFTNAQIIDYIYKKINIDKTHKVIDPFAGSGGFLLQAKKKFNLPSENIHAQEYDDKIYKFLKFNSMIAELEKDNMEKGDSYDYHDFLSEKQNSFDRVVTNPPFGESIDIILSDSERKDFWKLLKTGKYTIKDSMGLAVYAIYKLLKVGGIAGFVTDRGILNNGTENKSWQKKLRKEIINNCEIQEILLLPTCIFSHTNFGTAVIIFKKGKPTKEIKFYEGYFKPEDKGTSNKKMYIKENVLTVTFDQLKEKDWSLKYDDYVVQEEVNYNGIEYKSLGEVCEFMNLKIEKINKSLDVGNYPFYNCSIIGHKYTNNPIYDDVVLVMNKTNGSGKCLIQYNRNKFSLSGGVIIFKSKTNLISTKNLHIILDINKKKIEKLYIGGDKKNISLASFKNIKIPILSQEHQERIVNFMEEFINDDYSKLDKLVSKFKDYDLFNLLIKENYDGFKSLSEYYEDLIVLENQLSRFSTVYKRNMINRCFKTVKAEEKSLGEVCEIEKGSYNTKDIKGKGSIPYYNSGAKNPSSLHDDFTIDYPEYIIFIKDGGDKTNKLNLNCGMAKSYYVEGKTAINSHNLILKPKDFIICKYLYYYLESIRLDNMKLAKYGSGLGNITKNKYENINIKVPSLEDQQKVIDMINAIDEEDSKYNQMLSSIKDMIQTVYNSIELITDTNQNNQVEEKELISEDENEEIQNINSEDEETQIL